MLLGKPSHQRLLLVELEYFEVKITDNQSDNFLEMLSKNNLSFSLENLRKLYRMQETN